MKSLKKLLLEVQGYRVIRKFVPDAGAKSHKHVIDEISQELREFILEYFGVDVKSSQDLVRLSEEIWSEIEYKETMTQ